MTLELRATTSDWTDIAGLGTRPSLFCFSLAIRSRNLFILELGVLSVEGFASETVVLALVLVLETLMKDVLDEFNE